MFHVESTIRFELKLLNAFGIDEYNIDLIVRVFLSIDKCGKAIDHSIDDSFIIVIKVQQEAFQPGKATRRIRPGSKVPQFRKKIAIEEDVFVCDHVVTGPGQKAVDIGFDSGK